jgi:hypothetical protein
MKVDNPRTGKVVNGAVKDASKDVVHIHLRCAAAGWYF